jgi:hypothetical protein
MKEVILPVSAVFKSEKQIKSSCSRSARLWTFALAASCIGSLGLAFVSFSFHAIAFSGIAEDGKLFNRIGSLTTVAVFLLAMFCAHALDKIREIETREKRAAFTNKKP